MVKEYKEEQCLKCGKCCYIDGTNIKCPFLSKDNLCLTYNDRPDWCLSAKQMEEIYKLPEGCGYLRGEE